MCFTGEQGGNRGQCLYQKDMHLGEMPNELQKLGDTMGLVGVRRTACRHVACRVGRERLAELVANALAGNVRGELHGLPSTSATFQWLISRINSLQHRGTWMVCMCNIAGFVMSTDIC